MQNNIPNQTIYFYLISSQSNDNIDDNASHLASNITGADNSTEQPTSPSLVTHEDKVRKIIDDLEVDLEYVKSSGDMTIFNQNKKNAYAANDSDYMSYFVDKINNKYSEINLRYLEEPSEIGNEIKKCTEEGITSARFICNLHKNNIHFAVVDYKQLDEKVSVILFEPSRISKQSQAKKVDGGTLLAFLIRQSIKDSVESNFNAINVEMNIQKSESECGIFSLAIAKQLYIERDALALLHRDNTSNKFEFEPWEFFPQDKLDQYLPPSFYKHTQGKNRLSRYLRNYSQADNMVVNKKNQTLMTRFENHAALNLKDNKQISYSILEKRISKYKSLIE